MEGNCFLQTNNQTKARHSRGMQAFLGFLPHLQVSHGHRDLLCHVCCQTCTDSHTDCLKTKQSDSVQNVKCGWCKGFVDPLSPKMTSSPPDQEWSSHLVGACAGPCGWTVDIPRQRGREAPTDIADPQSRHWKKRNTHSCVNSLSNN